jgi:hypothetical protein
MIWRIDSTRLLPISGLWMLGSCPHMDFEKELLMWYRYLGLIIVDAGNGCSSVF